MLQGMPLRRTTSRLAATAFVCWLCASCTSHGDTTSPPDTSSAAPRTTATATAPQVTLTRASSPLRVTIGQLGDGVHRSERHRLRVAVGAPVAAWFDGAFLKPDYPASAFPDAFSSWTRGAAAQGAHDKDLTTNAALGPDLVALVADKQLATLYIFAHGGITGGATAKVRLVLTGEQQDGSLVHFAVSGDVYLTRDKQRWRIFGYDLQRSKEAS